MKGEKLKLNLGSGMNPKPGYVNVDKFGQPDVRHDLESFPWPWKDSSVSEVVLNHVLEHLGQTTEVYLGILREIYRVCADEALVRIVVPHPRHDDFMNDPTHVRVVTPESLALFSKRNNRKWIQGGHANSTLALYLEVDFEIVHITRLLDPAWAIQLQRNEITEADVSELAARHNNVIKEYRIDLRVLKPAADPA